jgi:hypothetical protein
MRFFSEFIGNLKFKDKDRMDIFKMLLEKFIIVIILGAGGYWANLKVTTFQHSLSRQDEFVAEKIRCTMELSKAYAKAYEHFSRISRGTDKVDKNTKARMTALRTAVTEAFNNSSVYFDDSLADVVYQHTVILQALADNVDPAQWKIYDPFMGDVGDNFQSIIRYQVGTTKDFAPNFCLVPLKINDESELSNAPNYFKANYEKWKQEHPS